MSKTRRNHESAFKAKAALEALKGEQTVAEIASKHGLHPTLVTEWKRQLAEGASAVFEKGAFTTEKDGAAMVALSLHHALPIYELVPKNWTDGLALDLISNPRERIRRR